jgi:carboxymethylenebutenolidase
MPDSKLSRREVLGAAAGLTGAAMLKPAAAQNQPASPAAPAAPPKEVPGQVAPGTVTGKDVTFKSGDTAINAYWAQPTNGTPKAGILVIHEIWGLTEHIRDVTRRFAAQGYFALAPDFFTRQGAPQLDPQNRDAMMKFLAGLSDRQVVADADAALSYLKANGAQKVGSVGFCMGGLYSYLLATKSTRLSAAVEFYGRIVYAETTENKPESPIDLALNLKCPLLANFGETDQSITVAQVEQFKEKLKQGEQPWKVNIYPGAGHAFFNDTRPSFNAGAAKDAWSETTAFFHKYLS